MSCVTEKDVCFDLEFFFCLDFIFIVGDLELFFISFFIHNVVIF